VVVTGGSRGIGREVALQLAAAGWDVCLSYRSDEAAAQEAVGAVRSHGRRALAVRADAGDSDDVTRLFNQAMVEFGRVDAVVANAGVIGEPRSILDADEAHLSAVFRTNVLGLFYCAREAARRMSVLRGGRGGAIVNLSSAAARHGGMPQEAHYAASKGAVDSLTIALARELAPHGLRVNAVRPGLIKTDIHDAHGGAAEVDRLAASVPLRRAGEASEVASVVAFLAGPGSSYMHGALVDVSGGR
jgi:NAD(P)-dependent dehydrogenase (short-subunit alcohol dehydrogenase family)